MQQLSVYVVVVQIVAEVDLLYLLGAGLQGIQTNNGTS